MNKTRFLTGITCTGTAHMGNYVGAIRPAIESSKNTSFSSFYFLADLHALIKCRDPKEVQESSYSIAATWLALGLDVDHSTFYRQSDVPEISELAWLLTCVTPKGLMNRAHAYKAALDTNSNEGKEPDHGVTMGLYGYPILMAADILMFNGDRIPVGKDQVQHVEMARDIAGSFNHLYGKHFELPEAMIDENVAILKGLDGRKMSKSYHNTIPIFNTAKKMQKQVNKIVTNLLEPGEPKDPDDSTVFQLWEAFATAEQTAQMRKAFEDGIAWGEAKKQLGALLNERFEEPKKKYDEIIEDKAYLEEVLLKGADKAREQSVPFLDELKSAVGVKPYRGLKN